MLWRSLALVGSAIYAYSIKYETILHAERIVKLKHEIAGVSTTRSRHCGPNGRISAGPSASRRSPTNFSSCSRSQADRRSSARQPARQRAARRPDRREARDARARRSDQYARAPSPTTPAARRPPRPTPSAALERQSDELTSKPSARMPRTATRPADAAQSAPNCARARNRVARPSRAASRPRRPPR